MAAAGLRGRVEERAQLRVTPKLERPVATPSDAKIESHLKDPKGWNHFLRNLTGHDLFTLDARSSIISTASHKDLYRNIQRVYEDRVSLFVHLSMNMGPTYATRPDCASFYDFWTLQMSKIDELDNAEGNRGKFLHFVGFNPFEANALEHVKEEYGKHGAIGVKFYPPAGYRASSYRIPQHPKLGIMADQRDGRYKGINESAS